MLANQLNAKDTELAKQSAEPARQASELADKDAILAEYKRLYGELNISSTNQSK